MKLPSQLERLSFDVRVTAQLSISPGALFASKFTSIYVSRDVRARGLEELRGVHDEYVNMCHVRASI